MAVAMKTEGHENMKPLMSPLDEFPSSSSCQQQDMESRLLELQADIINREELLNVGEKRLKNRELELNEREALLEARKQVVESSLNSRGKDAQSSISVEEREAFETLKRELDNQETSLKEARAMLHEREVYIEACENELVEKSMILTEREARVEQREEDFANKTANPFPAKTTAEP